MNTPEQLDELLKQGMENFHPTPPADVWTKLEQNLSAPNNASHASSSGKGVQVINSLKSMGIIGKFALVATIPAFATYLYFTSTPKQPETIQATQELVQAKSLEKPIENEIATTSAYPISQEKQVSQNQTRKHVGLNATNSAAQEPMSNSVPNQAILPYTSPISALEPKQDAITPVTSSPKPIVKTESESKQKPEESVSSTTTIRTKDSETLEQKIEIPNVFTPDGDGKNDKFEIPIESAIYYHLVIYDKIGKLIYESFQAGQNWDGLHAKTGMECEQGLYVYSLEYQLSNSQQIRTRTGQIKLFR